MRVRILLALNIDKDDEAAKTRLHSKFLRLVYVVMDDTLTKNGELARQAVSEKIADCALPVEQAIHTLSVEEQFTYRQMSDEIQFLTIPTPAALNKIFAYQREVLAQMIIVWHQEGGNDGLMESFTEQVL